VNWEVRIPKRVLKDIKRIPKKDAKRLLAILEEISRNPYWGDIKKIKGEENVWRRREGGYRILYEIHPSRKIIDIFRITRRSTTTYRKRK